ncbi:MAG: phosphate ABC transporter substrate-binding protein PstS [Gammaproteobacteria bacterium]
MKTRLNTKLLALATLLIITIGLSACSESEQKTKRLTGAGSSFVYPVMSKWAEDYQQLDGIQINYQSIGSGGGQRQIKAGTIDFAASDQPLEADELAESNLIQFPIVMGGIIMVVNIPGVDQGQLLLDGQTIASIYQGDIRQWDDERIAILNPELDLPDIEIAVIYRADSSGTTYNFADYLAKVDSDWRETMGVSTSLNWPTGIGAKGNAGVAAYAQTVAGSIGYVEYAYAAENGLNYTQLINQAGVAVTPTFETFSAAAVNANWQDAENFYLLLTDQPGEQSWPITATTFVLLSSRFEETEKLEALYTFFRWAYESGATTARDLDYVPIPEPVYKLVEQTWTNQSANIQNVDFP